MALPIISLLLLLVTARYAEAQSSSPSNDDDGGVPYSNNFNAATAILIVVLVSGFFFLAFFSIYFRRCSRDRSAIVPAAGGAVTASRRGTRRGLDPSILETFPTLSYSSVTGLKIGKESLECAVCLSEFTDDETLRMLPKCCHVFHPECIDTWLESHVTCPVCRENLALVATDSSDGISGAGEEDHHPQQLGGATCEQEEEEVAIDLARIGRSHTTGHVSEGVDRFTLRLPEHVRREIVAAGSLRRSASVAVFRGGGEGSSRRGYRGGGGGRSLRAVLSERWTGGILARVSTWRRGEAEGSSVKKGETSEGSIRLGMFNCINSGSNRGRGESSGVVADDQV